MRKTDASTATRKLLNEHGLDHMEVVFNGRLTRAFGRYRRTMYPERRWIELSSKLVEMNSEERVMRTIIHEVAHALTEGHGHDRVWKAKCLELGGDGIARYSTVDTNIPQVARSSKLYRLECVDCNYTGGRYRRKMNGYRHRGCGGDMISIEI